MAGKLKNYIANTTISGRFSKNDIVYAIQDNNWKGYTSLDVDVLCVGGGGGAGGLDAIPGAAGGASATIMGRVNVPTSKTLTVTVGTGGRGGSGPSPGVVGGTGGLPGGGQGGTSGGSGGSGSGGGGGGWSGIYDTSYSVFLDGTGDYLSVPSSTAFAFGSGIDFTVEGWVYLTSYSPGSVTGGALIGTASGAATGWYVNLGQDINSLRITSNASGAWADNISVTTGNGVPLNTWTHIAFVRNGGSLVLYKNGVSVASMGGAGAYNFTSPNNIAYIGYDNDGTYTRYVTGYISNVRVVKGTAVYTAAFTPPATPLTAITNTSLLTCQSSTIIDNGPNAFTITVSGDAVVTTNAGALVSYSNTEPFVRYFIAGGGSGGGGGAEGIQNDVSIAGGGIQWNGANGTSIIGTAGTNYPGDGGGTGGGGGGVYGGAGQSLPTGLSSGGGNYINPSYAVNSYFSNYFDGTGDYLTFTNTTAQGVNFGTGDFTVELWYYMTNNTTNSTYHTFLRQDTTTGAFDFGYRPSATQLVLARINTGEVTASVTLALNTWNHITVSRSGTDLRFFVNGTQVGSTATNSYDFSVTGGTVRIGSNNFDATYTAYGYISNLRGVRSAVYTSTFTPSTVPLTAITNTSLLTCQSSTIIDKSTNNFTITRNGDVIVREIHPFNIPTGNAELGGGIGISTGAVSMPANVSFFGYTSAGSGGTVGRSPYQGANGTVVIRYTGFQKAIGGNVDYDNGYTIHTYDSPGTFIVQ